MTFFLGLDLGQAQDHTALAILERRELLPDQATGERWPVAMPGGGHRLSRPMPIAPSPILSFSCGHLERLPLGTPYPAVADHVLGLLRTEPLRGQAELVVDATGVGRPVVDMLHQRGLKPIAITITGGDTASYDHGWRVPKRDLVGGVQVLLQTDRLKFSAEIPTVPQLVRELLAFRVKIDPLTAHDSYGAWREGAHDDLVLAVAVATWWGQRWRRTTGRFDPVPISG